MAFVSKENLTRFYEKLKEKMYLKSEVDASINSLPKIYYGNGTDTPTISEDTDEKWELIEDITFSEPIVSVNKTFEHEYKKISILTSVGGAQGHTLNWVVEGGTVGQIFNTQNRYRYILCEVHGDIIKTILSTYDQPYQPAVININQNTRAGKYIKGFSWTKCNFEAGVTMQIKGVRA